MISKKPLVSVILTTRNRPELLSLALRYYCDQCYHPRELVVVDDSDMPAKDPILANPDVQYIYLDKPLPLGTKLNLGIDKSNGSFILKMDDDDFYAANFLTQMMDASASREPELSISFLQPFLFLDLRTMQVRISDPQRCSGATFFFHRKYWQRQPFRDLPSQVDAYFLLDHDASKHDKRTFNRVRALESFLQVRHVQHLWNYMPDEEPFDQYLQRQRLYHKKTEQIVPRWAYQEYLRLQGLFFKEAK